MKRTLIIMSLAVLLIMPLIITGCDGGTTLTDSDVAAIQGFGTRLDSHDSSIATINNTLNSLDTETLNGLAALDADDLAALLDLDLDDALADISQLQSDMTALKGTTIPGLEGRVEDIENGQTPPDTEPPVTTGQVAAVFDPVPPAIVSGSGLPIQQFNIVITNGTATWQYVSYSLILTCKASPPTTGATIADLTAMVLNTGFSASLAFTYNFVANTAGNVTQITIYPVHGVAAGPGTASPTILNYLNFNLPGSVAIQEWNCTIIPVASPSSW